jgi:hypothetical protein
MELDPENRKEFNGQILCEDCYIDALTPPKACDPWAVYAAKSFVESANGQPCLNETQQRMIELLKTNGPTAPVDMADRLQLKLADVEREAATLRHMGIISGALIDGKRVIRLMEA